MGTEEGKDKKKRREYINTEFVSYWWKCLVCERYFEFRDKLKTHKTVVEYCRDRYPDAIRRLKLKKIHAVIAARREARAAEIAANPNLPVPANSTVSSSSASSTSTVSLDELDLFSGKKSPSRSPSSRSGASTIVIDLANVTTEEEEEEVGDEREGSATPGENVTEEVEVEVEVPQPSIKSPPRSSTSPSTRTKSPPRSLASTSTRTKSPRPSTSARSLRSTLTKPPEVVVKSAGKKRGRPTVDAKVVEELKRSRQTCYFCDEEFASFLPLCTHIRIHTEEAPFGCNACGKEFKTYVEKATHMLRHDGEKTSYY